MKPRQILANLNGRGQVVEGLIKMRVNLRGPLISPSLLIFYLNVKQKTIIKRVFFNAEHRPTLSGTNGISNKVFETLKISSYLRVK